MSQHVEIEASAQDVWAVPEAVGESCTSFELTMEYELPFGPLGRLAGRLGAERRAVVEAAEVVEGVRRVVMERSGTK